jgi:hypothetical protein
MDTSREYQQWVVDCLRLSHPVITAEETTAWLGS